MYGQWWNGLTGMPLARKTPMRDVKDVEAFVIMCIKRSGVRPHPREYEDLVATGLCLLWEMSLRYDDEIGCFSGYALRYMPRKMKEAYHRSHPHHINRTQPDGKRKWEVGDAPSSWDLGMDETRLRVPGDFIPAPHGGDRTREPT